MPTEKFKDANEVNDKLVNKFIDSKYPPIKNQVNDALANMAEISLLYEDKVQTLN